MAEAVLAEGVERHLKLYEYTEQYEQIHELLNENGGELTPEIEERLCALNDELPVKVERISALIRRNTCGAEAIDSEIQRLTKLKRSRQNTADRLKNYLLHNLQEMGLEKVETPLFTVRVQKNSVPQVIFTGLVIPEEFRKEPPPPPEPEIDPKKVLAFQKSTGELPADFDAQYGYHVRIR